jgi:hypothetical protein
MQARRHVEPLVLAPAALAQAWAEAEYPEGVFPPLPPFPVPTAQLTLRGLEVQVTSQHALRLSRFADDYQQPVGKQLCADEAGGLAGPAWASELTMTLPPCNLCSFQRLPWTWRWVLSPTFLAGVGCCRCWGFRNGG